MDSALWTPAGRAKAQVEAFELTHLELDTWEDQKQMAGFYIRAVWVLHDVNARPAFP